MSLENTSKQRIDEIVEAQKAYFDSGATLEYEFRREQLLRLKKALQEWHKPLCDALWQDLHKSEQVADEP